MSISSYNKTSWTVGNPITQEKMNKIENGISDVTEEANRVGNLTDQINTRVGQLSSLSNDITNRNSIVDAINSVGSKAKDAIEQASEAAQDTVQGKNAWTQIAGAITFDPQSGEITKNLATRLSEISNQATEAYTRGDTAYREVEEARGRLLYGLGNNTPASKLKDKIDNMDLQIGQDATRINTSIQNYDNAKGWYGSLQERLNSIDGDISNTGVYSSKSLASHVADAEALLENARKSGIYNIDHTTLDDRLEFDETKIQDLDNYKLDKRLTTDNPAGDVVNTLDSTSTDKVLSAAQGRELRRIIGGVYTTSNTVADAINTAQTNATNSAQTYADTNKVDKTDIKKVLTYDTDDNTVLQARQGKLLQDQIDSINSGLNTASTGLVARVSANESAISTLNGSASTTGSVLNTVNSRIAEVVNNAPEAFDTLKEIADWIGNNSDDALTMQTNISNNASAISGLDTRLTAIDNSTNGRMKVAEDDIDALETTVGNNSSGLVKGVADNASAISSINTAISHAASGNDPGGLTERIATLENEPKSATEIITADCITYNNETGIPTVYTNNSKTTAITPTEDKDYLLGNEDGKYYYWKYIGTAPNGTWNLISGDGGSGTGSSSGEFAASLSSTDIPEPDVNTDYFVGNNTIGYTHYRYVIPEGETVGDFVRILPKGLIQGASVTANGGLSAHTLEDPSTNVFNNFVALKSVSYDVVQRNGVDTTVITFIDTNGTSHNVDVVGGGGSGASQTVRLNNTLSSLNLTVPDKEGVVTTLRAKAVVKDGSEIDTNFSAALNVATQYTLDPNGAWTNFTTQQVQNNVEFSVNISSILRTGVKTYVRLVLTTVIEEATVTRTIVYEVSKVEMSIAAVNFNPAIVRTTDFNFAYRCMGSGLTKVIHFLIDGEDAITPVTTTLHNDRDQQVIPVTGLTPGMHSFRVYFTVDGVESNILNYYILYNNDSARIAPMVALAAENDTITYGDDLQINYTVATIGSETTESVLLELFTMDGQTEVPVTSTTLENVANEQTHTWRPVDYPESGIAYVRATATHTVDDTPYTDSKTISITINALETSYDLTPAGASSLIYSYTTYGRSNNDVGKETYNYTYRTIHNENITWNTNFNGFNWSGDGYKDGALIISGGATLTADITPFQTAKNGYTLENTEGIEDISQNGRTIEIEYEVQSATNLNDVIIDCMANTTTTVENGVIKKGGTGFQVTPQSCYLLRNGTTVNTDDTGFILNESDIAAAYLTPGTRLHLAFVIEPWSDTLAYDNSYHQSVNIYVNGEFANACPYVRGTADFGSTATLRIGSASCIIKLYQIKVYNRGLTHSEILQNYKMAPATTRDKLVRFEDNDILNDNGKVDYEKARTKYTCLLLTGPEPIEQEGIVINPTVSPYKGYPSPAHRRDKKTNEAVGKTESGVTLTKANPNKAEGYDIEFDLRDKVPTDQSIEVPEYIGDRGAYVSSNNVQGTSSQKYPVHNLKIYLAKWQGPKTTTTEVALQEGEDTTGLEIVEHDGVQYKVVTTTSPAEIKKVKYSLKGKDENGEDIGSAESTLCWKADYMSTDHANTFNANIADKLFTDVLPGASWGSKHQNTVYGIRCLLFQKQGDNEPEFLGDGCLNNDKGNNKTYSLERNNEDGKSNDTLSQKWEFTNNSDDLGYFKTDTVFRTVGEGANAHIQAKDAFESTYPDEGDLKDAGVEPNYNHLQILLTWLSKRANYWDASTETGTGGTYNGTSYTTERELKQAIFKNEFTQHFNMNHALTYYLFSEYIALCDNRVKNMFLRSDNVTSETVLRKSTAQPIFEGNSNPNADFFKEIDAINTGETQQVAVEDPETHEITYETQPVYKYELHNRDDIDWENSTFAIWAPVLYDLDSCFGVENVGYIRVRYDANWDYTWNGAPQFNGYESRLWLQFADCFDTEIKAAALPLYNRADGLNYTNFYRQQITGNLSNISPALSNQDMLVKFDKPWSEGFINYSLAEPAMETPYYKYLQRGSRTAQKTAFMNMRSKLLSSKYGANEFTNDAIKFRTGVPVGQTNLADTKITIIANQAMYPGVAYGDNKDPTRAIANGGKVNAGQSCDIQATSPVQGNDGIFICGASLLTDIGDLSAFRPYQIDVGAGVNLKRLVVGSNAAGYTNGNTDTFMNLNKCVLLEEVNIQNCSNVATLDLSNNALIKRVYAAGSGATTIIFPNGGVLTTVEYSANTGNITLLNQGSLTDFIYEGASTNHYSSLTKLWVENTPNVPIVDIINTALSGLTAGVRLAGIDIDLGNDPIFLQTITSELAKGKYINSAGTMIAGNTDYPYISGKVHISSIRSSLLAKVNELYPNLIVYNTMDNSGNITNNIIQEYDVIYKSYNESTILYTDHRASGENVIDPVYDVNPITNDHYIGMPEKPDDVQFQYRFGTYDARNNYRRFSGWVYRGTTNNPTSSSTVNSTITFVAYFPTTVKQQYTVQWYDRLNGTVMKSMTVDYGTDLSAEASPIDTGALSRTNTSGTTHSVFTGWSRPVGKITSNVNVYAQWQTSTINDSTPNIVMETLNAADLYALSLTTSNAKANTNQLDLTSKLGSVINIPMGYDYNYVDGVTTTDLLANIENNTLILDGTIDPITVYNSIKPLATNSDWTLAIDYKMLMDTQASFNNGREFVLVSCYQNANSSIIGFKVSLVRTEGDNTHTIKVTWGTAETTIDYAITDTTAGTAMYFTSYRNVVVLNHNADTPNILRVSYVAPDLTNANAPSGANCGSYVTNELLTWNSNTPISAPLILGGNYQGTTTVIEEGVNTRRPAQGIIYWAKFWDTDLGETGCSQLASWPHETVPFYLSGYNDGANTSSEQIYGNTELSFTAAQGLGDRFFYPKRAGQDPDANELYGWHISVGRNICNDVIYKGMPEAYKSIIKNLTVDSAVLNTVNGGSTYATSNDYLFFPAYRELYEEATAGGNWGGEVLSKWSSPWHWMVPAEKEVLVFQQGSTQNVVSSTAPSINVFRYRFLGTYVSDNARIFNLDIDPTGRTLRYVASDNTTSTITPQNGDMWINLSDNSIAYIYVDDEQIALGAKIDSIAASGYGGWKRADMWQLRSFCATGQNRTPSENCFARIGYNGLVTASPAASSNTTDPRLLCPEFTI